MSRHDDILTGIYHLGQEKIWDGRVVLDDLVKIHGKPSTLEPKIQNSLARIFTMILKGEEAAWKISLQLAAMLDNVPARMAATSQAHDEARHVALGVQHLPVIMNTLSPVGLLSLTTWQFRLFMLELQGLRDMRRDFEIIGLCPDGLFDLAEKKQLEALEEVAEQLGWSPTTWKPLHSVLRYQKQRILG